jgi:deazaflavin-dependent oxidoreductase (nitroreductase family)
MAENFKAGGADWVERHLEAYLRTDGQTGHLVDFSDAGGSAATPCLVLEVTGRKSGEPQRLPLIYGKDGNSFVLVASKGGAPKHPAWYLNLEANPALKFQVADKKYRGRARVAAGPERERLFDMMAQVFPPYIAYQKKTEREIPVVVLESEAEIDRL